MSKTNNHAKVYINSKGERVLRITEVIKTLSKDSLIFWANMLGFKRIKYRDELERTANIGSLVHGLLEDFSSPNILAVADYEAYGVVSYRDQIEANNAINSFFLWYRENSKLFKPVFTEKVIIGESVGGTVDVGLQGIKDPNKVILGDYKTSGDLYLTMYLQLAGYVELYEEVNGPDTVEGAAVFLLDKKEGLPATVGFISRESLDPYINAFRVLLQTAMATKCLDQMYRNDVIKLEEWNK